MLLLKYSRIPIKARKHSSNVWIIDTKLVVVERLQWLWCKSINSYYRISVFVIGLFMWACWYFTIASLLLYNKKAIVCGARKYATHEPFVLIKLEILSVLNFNAVKVSIKLRFLFYTYVRYFGCWKHVEKCGCSIRSPIFVPNAIRNFRIEIEKKN